MVNTFQKEIWYKDEDNTEWEPTDLHAATAHKAFPEEPTDTEYFKNTLRKKYGKPTNFACTYGASINTLFKQFGFPLDKAERLHNGFYQAFPMINKYANWVNTVCNRQGYITNLFGRRYYNCPGHKARNYLIQGSAADYLKIKLVELQNFIDSHNLKTRIQSTIHDEVVFEVYKGETKYVKDFLRILQDFPGTLIPLISDPEVTYTYWNEKEDAKECDY
jgi:DNA polymerase-1